MLCTLPRPFQRPAPADAHAKWGTFRGSLVSGCAGWGGEPSPQIEQLRGLAPIGCSESTLGAAAGRRPETTRLSRPQSTKPGPLPLPRAVLSLLSSSQASGDQAPPPCCRKAESNLFTKQCFYCFFLPPLAPVPMSALNWNHCGLPRTLENLPPSPAATLPPPPPLPPLASLSISPFFCLAQVIVSR